MYRDLCGVNNNTSLRDVWCTVLVSDARTTFPNYSSAQVSMFSVFCVCARALRLFGYNIRLKFAHEHVSGVRSVCTWMWADTHTHTRTLHYTRFVACGAREKYSNYILWSRIPMFRVLSHRRVFYTPVVSR